MACTLDEFFSARRVYIPDEAEQLRMRELDVTTLFDQDPISRAKFSGIDCRRISIDDFREFKIPIVHLTGWGSGWEGILPLGFSMACEGYEAYHLSLPGYGGSYDPPKEYWKSYYLKNAAQTIGNWCGRVGLSEIYAVGHSMGGEIMTYVAYYYPELVKKLVLLSPSGMWKYGFFEKPGLIWDFAMSGKRLRGEYEELLEKESGYDYIKPLIDWCGRQKSPWGWGRIRQRIAEFQAICEGTLLKTLRNVRVPVVYISGTEDTVFPARNSLEAIREACRQAPSFQSSILSGVHHNPTLFHSEITAAMIAHFLEG